ncbi:hypothetical protein SLS54_004610 [Diplodia seriata]
MSARRSGSEPRQRANASRLTAVCSFHPLSIAIPDLSAALSSDPACLPPPGHHPRASSDAVLTAIAQLATLRLGVQRATISLIDTHSQIVLTEATPTLPVCRNTSTAPGDANTDAGDALWLGTAAFPRGCGVCELVVDAGPLSAVVINDLRNDQRFHARSFVQHDDGPQLRFYAAVPLVAHTGSVVGSLAVFDDTPRDGLAPHQLCALHDVAAAAMSYLNVSRALDDNQRGERMVRGLTSFVTGASDLQGRAELDEPHSPHVPMTASPLPQPSDQPVLERPVANGSPVNPVQNASPAADMQTPQSEDDLFTLQDIILPSGAKRMFSRAANIMRDSSGLSGVIIFDASLANPGGSGESTPSSASADTDDPSSEDDSVDSDSPSLCKILGFADTEISSRAGTFPKKDYLALAESDLKRLLNQNPQGKVFHLPPSPDSESSSGDDVSSRRKRKRRGSRKTKFSAVNAIMDIAQDSRSAAIVPLWDFQRERWFAGCLCWTTDPRRQLSYGSDLLYLRTFGNSIMAELSRLDALSIDRAKTTFVESMSHELRSPLHGILGGVEYLQSMPLDSFQTSVVASIGVCGRTLLDTVRNVLEYSKINERAARSDRPPKDRRPTLRPSLSTPTVDIRQLTEETVEAVFSGHSFTVSSTQGEEADEPFLHPTNQEMPSPPMGDRARRTVRIILNMPDHRSWLFAMQPGVWRRILMNLFGNALKYTSVGFIRVSLSATDLNDFETKVSLTVKDSGAGMSSQFLQNGLFKPFSQENPFAPGTGLGLSIVRRLVDSLGGKINVQSTQDVGTEIRVTATLAKRAASGENAISTIAERLRGRSICIPGELLPKPAGGQDAVAQGEHSFVKSIAGIVREWFRVETVADVDPEADQLVIYPGPNMEYMSRPRPFKGMTVVVAVDATEAATLRTDARIVGGWIEVITQPCGPFKLAKLLELYINRQSSTPGQSGPPGETRTLPYHPSPSNGAVSPHESPRSRSVSSQRQQRGTEILIVDDNAINVRLASAFLKKNGFPDFSSAKDGLEALNMFKADPLRWAAILMDLSMPVMDGVTATREIRAWEKKRTDKRREGKTGVDRLTELKSPNGGDEEGRAAGITGEMNPTAFEGRSASSEQTEDDSNAADDAPAVPAPAPSSKSGVQIIVTTGLGSASARFEAMSAGANEYMTKPIQFAALTKMIRERMEAMAASAAAAASVPASPATSTPRPDTPSAAEDDSPA